MPVPAAADDLAIFGYLTGWQLHQTNYLEHGRAAGDQQPQQKQATAGARLERVGWRWRCGRAWRVAASHAARCLFGDSSLTRWTSEESHASIFKKKPARSAFEGCGVDRDGVWSCRSGGVSVLAKPIFQGCGGFGRFLRALGNFCDWQAGYELAVQRDGCRSIGDMLAGEGERARQRECTSLPKRAPRNPI